MRTKKVLSILGVGLALVVAITGCSKEAPLDDYDNNEVLARESNALAVSNEECRLGEGTIKLSARVSGMAQIWSYEVTESTEIDISAQLKILAGKAKVVMITPDGTVTTIVEDTSPDANASSEEHSVALAPGKTRMKVVAVEGTTLELTMTATLGTFTSLWDKGNVTQNPIADLYSVTAEELYPYRTSSLTNSAAVDALMKTLRFPDTFAYRAAETADGMTTIVFDTNSDDRSLYVGEEYQWPFYKNALYIFSLVENAQQVTFHIYDEATTPLEIVYSRDMADEIMGESFYAKGETLEDYMEIIKAIDDSFDPWDLTIPEKPNK